MGLKEGSLFACIKEARESILHLPICLGSLLRGWWSLSFRSQISWAIPCPSGTRLSGSHLYNCGYIDWYPREWHPHLITFPIHLKYLHLHLIIALMTNLILSLLYPLVPLRIAAFAPHILLWFFRYLPVSSNFIIFSIALLSSFVIFTHRLSHLRTISQSIGLFLKHSRCFSLLFRCIRFEIILSDDRLSGYENIFLYDIQPQQIGSRLFHGYFCLYRNKNRDTNFLSVGSMFLLTKTSQSIGTTILYLLIHPFDVPWRILWNLGFQPNWKTKFLSNTRPSITFSSYHQSNNLWSLKILRKGGDG